VFWFQIPYRDDQASAANDDQGLDTRLIDKSCMELSLQTMSEDGIEDGKAGNEKSSSAICEKNPKKSPTSTSLTISLSNSTPAPCGPLVILIVDDAITILKMTAMMLEGHKHSVATARNGAEAVEMIRRQREQEGKEYDVVLMDLQMPVMDGLEAVRRVQEWEKKKSKEENCLYHQVILANSANSDAETTCSAYEAGVDGVMTKPFLLSTFYRTFEQAKQVKKSYIAV
jgi:CheY-like chemotaxis protein